MTSDQDPLKEHLNPGLNLFPEVDMEASIMAAVRKEAEFRRKARSLRRRGVLCLTFFVFVAAMSLWYTKIGYSGRLYQQPLVNSGLALLLTLLLFVQLEVWWNRSLPEG